MRIGISLPVRELGDDVEAIKDFARAAEELGFTHLRVPDQIIRAGSGPLHEPLSLLAMLAGQALIFGSTALLGYSAAVALAFHLFVVLYEEPHLRRKFGSGYEDYCRTVPRWLPRRRGAAGDASS